MPLSALQTKLLRLLASHRNPESSIAGATPLSRTGPRVSDDIDIFHDRGEAVAQSASIDGGAIERAGYALRWVRQDPGFWSAIVSDESGATKLEWVHDSNYRFFPVLPDAEFGYVLHPVDIATNKALARAGIEIGAIDVVELNEAFASQAIACARELGIRDDILNLDGGAIALGHPLGATGARITGKAASLLARTGGRYALASQCIGGGQGIATILEAV